MVYNATEPKALLLSKEETLALLDLCLNSGVETHAAHEKALEKLGDLARGYMSEEISAASIPEPIATPVMPEPTYILPVRMSFWSSGGIRSRLRSLPPVLEVEACR